MADKTDPHRILDIKALLKSVADGEESTLADLAAVWGVTKPRFVNKRAEIAGFPEPRIDGVKHWYPTRAALEVMLGHLEGHASKESARQSRLASMLPQTSPDLHHFSPADIARINRSQADIEERERAQGLYVPMADVMSVAGLLFSTMSEFMSGLSNAIDPHGRLAPEVRRQIDTQGKEGLLKLHRVIKGMLDNDADDGAPGKPAGRTGRTPARRKREAGVRSPA